MVPSITPQTTGLRSQLVAHLASYTAKQRIEISRLYEAPSKVEELADFLIAHPEHVLETARKEIESSLAWRLVEEAVLEHDLGLDLDWAPVKHHRLMIRLGLLRPKRDGQGKSWAVMPGALAAIFADRVTGQRSSLVILLGRAPEERVSDLAKEWGLSTEGSKVEQILRICDHFAREDMVMDLLEALPNPDWIGDAMMVMELGGVCYWQQVFGVDVEANGQESDNVVPLMRLSERRQQREIAEALTDLGVLFRLELEGMDYPMVAVPEELWSGLWQLGRQWLMEWAAQAEEVVEQTGMGRKNGKPPVDLQAVLKWFLCEELQWDSEGLTAETREKLAANYHGDQKPHWEDWWELAQEFRVLWADPTGEVAPGIEAPSLLRLSREQFQREGLREWCMGYGASLADAHLGEAVGLDDPWRRRAMKALKKNGDWVPLWMELEGVESTTTGGGWLRESGTGPEEIVLYEAGVTTAFVLMTKLTWLDLLSLLDKERFYSVKGLVGVLQSVAGLSMFSQLGLVLEQQPAAIYLPFQRASFMMDQRHQPRFEEWVKDIIDHLLIPLGVASYGEDEDLVWLDTAALRIDNPPGWPPEQRHDLMTALFGNEVEFELPEQKANGLRQVAPTVSDEANQVSVQMPLDEILEAAVGREVIGFDGEVLEFRPEK